MLLGLRHITIYTLCLINYISVIDVTYAKSDCYISQNYNNNRYSMNNNIIEHDINMSDDEHIILTPISLEAWETVKSWWNYVINKIEWAFTSLKNTFSEWISQLKTSKNDKIGANK